MLYYLHESAKRFFEDQFAKEPDAKSYLAKRGLFSETISEFGIGFAPGGGEALTLHLIQKGYDVNDIARAGLAHKSVRGLYHDRFQDRIIFPIANAVGKVVAFTGRLLPRESRAPDPRLAEMPKYLNSPETPIFNKSKILFGFEKAKTDIGKTRSVVIVEGQMDMVMAWQAGIRNAVAVSGTGLTNHHLERLRRMADTMHVCFDNDDACIRALDRSMDLLNPFDFDVKAIHLGSFKDPADAVQEDPRIFTEAVSGARPAFAYLLEHLFRNSGSDLAQKKRAIQGFLLKVKKLKSAAEQDAWVKELSRVSGISEVALITELADLSEPKRPTEVQNAPQKAEAQGQTRALMLGRRILAIAFTKDAFWDIIQSHKARFPEVLQRIIENPQADEGTPIVLESGMLDADAALLGKELNDLLKQLQLETLRKEQERLRNEMRLAERNGNEEQATAIMGEIGTVAQKINELQF